MSDDPYAPRRVTDEDDLEDQDDDELNDEVDDGSLDDEPNWLVPGIIPSADGMADEWLED